MQVSDNPEWSTVHRLVNIFWERGLAPGDKVPAEKEISSLLGVSRPVVREAFSVLEATGLLVARKGSGRILMPFGFGSVISLLSSYTMPRGKLLLDLLAVRQVMETNMLPAAAAVMPAEDMEKLEKLVQTMELKASRGEYFGEVDRQFHSLLYKCLNNEVLLGLLDLFWTMYDDLDTGALSHSQRLDETAAHHRRILAALQSGDIHRAQYHLDAHFYDTGYVLHYSDTAKASVKKLSAPAEHPV
ncbi:FadR/GntR family transcriptional regulator [Shumkonia mesophila]|uniref:FadR/GntR family transcriptional regulator n=1 Tax=Shumkonia mesophila TaxID=2838854 RepID=UPI0029347C5B|nr:FCD domain-containing protein [Shumkonia mesophila]